MRRRKERWRERGVIKLVYFLTSSFTVSSLSFYPCCRVLHNCVPAVCVCIYMCVCVSGSVWWAMNDNGYWTVARIQTHRRRHAHTLFIQTAVYHTVSLDTRTCSAFLTRSLSHSVCFCLLSISLHAQTYTHTFSFLCFSTLHYNFLCKLSLHVMPLGMLVH